MRCPNCAEKFRWVRLVVRANCPHCSLPIRSRFGSISDETAREDAKLLVDRPIPRSDWWWLLAGCVVTIILSLTPTGGLVTGLVLPLAQVFAIERSTRRGRRLFPFLHGLTFDFVSGFVFILLIFVDAMAGAIVGPLAAVLTLPAFLLSWAVVRSLGRSHLRRVAEARPPHVLMQVTLISFGILLVAPPVIFSGVFLMAATDIEPQAASTIVDPDVFLKTMSTGAILATDLFLLPLWACIGIMFAGFVPAPANATWVGSWWVFGFVSLALATEVVLDNALDRRKRFSRTTWPRVQFLLTPFTVLAIVLVLGHDMPWAAQALAFFAAVGIGGLLKFGAVETAKRATSLLPGALAQRKALLYTAPFRIAGALALAFLAWQAPLISSILVFVAAMIAAGVLGFLLLVRRIVRREARLECTGCGTRPLETARLCPQCHQPVMASRLATTPESALLPVLEVAAAMAWADGTVKPEEADLLTAAAKASGLSPDEVSRFEQMVSSGVSLDDIALSEIPFKLHEITLDLAATVAISDGAAGSLERELWRDLAGRLGDEAGLGVRLPKKMAAWF